MPQYFGKYRGTVEDNYDPLGVGRLKVKVPHVFDLNPAWAMPCVPYAGDEIGFFAMPPVGAHVWVEFEQGDDTQAIWSGCFWGEDESAPVETSQEAANKKVIKTESCTLTLDDSDSEGGITIEYNRLTIKLTSQDIEISSGNGAVIKISGNQVDINEGALQVK